MAVASPTVGTEAAAVRREEIRAIARRSLSSRRIRSRLAVPLCLVAVCISLTPLAALVGYTVARGFRAISLDFFTHTPTPPGIPGGGVENYIVGTVVIVGIATLIAVPLGLATALFLLERRGRIADMVRFCADVLTGVPSIAIGIFAYSVLVEPWHFSGLAGSLALAVLMLPIMIRASEAAMRSVPSDLRDAGLALGSRRGRVMRSVVLRGAVPGLVTGNLLAVARAVGETAPLLFTAAGNTFFTLSPLNAMGALPPFIYSQGTQPYPDAQRQAWGAALVLLSLVLLLSISARAVAARLNRRAR
ncbi:MAG TPA: phosphate ABC transporter permease PstA [Acidimicrobiales bacterium]